LGAKLRGIITRGRGAFCQKEGRCGETLEAASHFTGGQGYRDSRDHNNQKKEEKSRKHTHHPSHWRRSQSQEKTGFSKTSTQFGKVSHVSQESETRPQETNEVRGTVYGGSGAKNQHHQEEQDSLGRGPSDRGGGKKRLSEKENLGKSEK